MKQLPIVFSVFGHEYIANEIHKILGYEIGKINFHQFPDEEVVVKIDSDVEDKEIIFVASLDRPNSKIFSLISAVETVRSLGAKKIKLVCPYLPYMRQDKSFHVGEGITSQYFAKLISYYFEELITIDPHLHRWHSLSDIYTIPSKVQHATHNIATWIKHNVAEPIIIGPDMESIQWVSTIAQETQAPFIILEKTRKDDDCVQISIPQIEGFKNHTPILVDDIISTAVTMIETVKQLKILNTKSPVCIGVHAIFAHNAYDDLCHAGAEKIITCNTIPHFSNGIDISDLIIEGLM